MKKPEFCKIFATGFVCSCALMYSPSAQAQIPVENPQATTHNFKTFLENVKNGVYLEQGTMYLNKGTAALGDPLGTISEYTGGMGEKIQKHMEKLQEYKEKVEEYKAEYDKYKKMVKENYDQAMAMKGQIEDGINTAKGLANDAKDMAGTVGSLGDIAKGQLGGVLGSVTGEVNGISGMAGIDASGLTSSLTGGSGSNKGYSGEVGDNYSPDEQSELGMQQPEMNASDENVSAMSRRQAFGNVRENLTALRRQEAAVSAADMALQDSSIASQPVSAAGVARVSDAMSAKVSAASTSLRDSKALSQPVSAAGVARVSDAMSAKVSAASTSLRDSKALSQPVSAAGVARVSDAMSAKVSAASTSLRDSKALSQPVSAAATAIRMKEAVEANATQKIPANAVLKKDIAVKANNRSLKRESVDGNLSVLRKKTTEIEKEEEVSPRLKRQLRRSSFKTYEKRSSVDLPATQHFASIKNYEPLAFAKLEIPGMERDSGTDGNGSVLVPPSLNFVCDLNSKKVLEAGAMNECLVKINDSQKGAPTEENPNLGAYYRQGEKEWAAVYVAEAYKAQQETEDFTDKILNPIEVAPSPQTLDIYSNIVETNRAVVQAINGLLHIKSTRLALESYENYGRFKFSSPEEEE